MRTFAVAVLLLLCSVSDAQITIAHLSDTHIDLATAPGTEERLRQAVEMINARNVDAIIVTGDIGEQYEDSWRKARDILKQAKAPVYYAPGNHDDSYRSTERFAAAFGHNYYVFCVHDVVFLVLDSQMLGNFDDFNSKEPMTIPPEFRGVAENELQWLEHLPANVSCRGTAVTDTHVQTDKSPSAFKRIVIAVQHVPPDWTSGVAPDDRPYWILHDPYRQRELDDLHRLGVKDILAGHWHKGVTYEKDGFHYHIAPATSWSPASPLGFAIEKISASGDVTTEFVYLPKTK